VSDTVRVGVTGGGQVVLVGLVPAVDLHRVRWVGRLTPAEAYQLGTELREGAERAQALQYAAGEGGPPR
jgi:hypothetical protein